MSVWSHKEIERSVFSRLGPDARVRLVKRHNGMKEVIAGALAFERLNTRAIRVSTFSVLTEPDGRVIEVRGPESQFTVDIMGGGIR